MKLLAIDTSTEMCSVALQCGDVVVQRMESQKKHSVVILEMIDAVLAEGGLALTGLDALAYGRGPGMFTGLRIAAGVVQGLALGADLPVVPVSSLAALAQGVKADRVLACMDARMSQVYAALYERNDAGLVQLHASTQEQLADPESIVVPDTGQWTGAGSGWEVSGEALKKCCGTRIGPISDHRYPEARDVLILAAAQYHQGCTVVAERALPVYLRDKVAKTISERGR